ncbi:serine hydrolase domain-containing protein [Pendulispora albinea]|uniref:Beta-lactamase family protein n=1 Tax=Pendulispora albinea TaxID=2741071 RepID=A0ABZ2M0H3_9BACT
MVYTSTSMKPSRRSPRRKHPWAWLAAVACIGQIAACKSASSTSTPFLELEQRTRSGEIPNIHSVLVLQHGKTLAEWYLAGDDSERGRALGTVNHDPTTLHDARSISKSVVSLLFGIAVSDRVVKSLDAPVLDHFPEYADLRTPDRLKIRLRDLLSMTMGVAWDEESAPYGDLRNNDTAMDMAPDRYRYALERPIVAPPGEKFQYSGACTALAAAILARATGVPLDVYAQQKLWEPLGVTKQVWLKDEKGVPIAASGLRLTPRDMGKIGQMILDHGRWNGQQVVPVAWIDDATALHAQMDPDPKCGWGYGYHFWRSPGCIVTPPTPLVMAAGYGGQRIWMVPSRDLVVVVTAGNYERRDQSKISSSVLTGVLAIVPAP